MTLSSLKLLLPTCLFAAAAISATAQSPGAPGTYDVLDYGARGDATTNDTAAIQHAVDDCASHGGGQVLLPGGKTFLAGAITLRSGVDFHLARGAVLKGSPRWQDYGTDGALLFAKDATGVSISGDGTLDGNDHAVWQALADEQAGGDQAKPGWWPQSFCGVWWPFGRPAADKTLAPGRPMMILLIGCQQVHLHGITLRHASTWTVHPVGCEDVVIDSIHILNDWNVANNDGIDLDHCRNVQVANCHIDTADDGIVLKNTPNFASYGGCDHITVTGCTIASRSCALKLDEAYATPGIRNVVFDACVISHSNRGLCIQSRDAGDIENVLFANMIIETQLQPAKWWGAGEPIHISQLPRFPSTRLGHVRHIRFYNVLCQGESGIYLKGCAASPLEDVQLDGVRMEIGKTSEVPGGFYDDRPIGSGASGAYAGLYTNAVAGLYAREVDGLSLRNLQIIWTTPKNAIYGATFDESSVSNLDLENDNFSLPPAAK